jgi:hypothetical protein
MRPKMVKYRGMYIVVVVEVWWMSEEVEVKVGGPEF